MGGEFAASGKQAAEITRQVRRVMNEAASRALLPRFQGLRAGDVAEKSPGEVVTVADTESEAILLEGLAKILPGALMLGEEAAHADPDMMSLAHAPLCWIIDPLDGTGYYARGTGPFGIMVALSTYGTTIGGWILDPLSGRFCSAVLGGGARIDERSVAVPPSTRKRPLTGLSPLLRTRPGRVEQITARLAPTHDLTEIPRCAAERYPAMVLGSADLTLYERTLPWDHAAGVLLLEEAGGRCARLDGSPFRVDDERTGLLAAGSSFLWDEAAGLLEHLIA